MELSIKKYLMVVEASNNSSMCCLGYYYYYQVRNLNHANEYYLME